MKKTINLITVFSCSILFFISCTQQNNFTELRGPYFGQESPGLNPEIFARGIVSTGMTEGAIAFTPDGKECYWTIHPNGTESIAMSKIINGKWTKPEIAPFCSRYLDGFPSIHPDGSRLYFHSFRPTGDTIKFQNRLNIWYVERIGDGWSEAKLVDDPVNGNGNAACPSVTEKGTLYFSKICPDGLERIVRSEFINKKFMELELLPDKVNTSDYNFHACVATDESYLIIPRTGRDDLIGADWNYYVSFRDENGQWGDLKNLGYKINNVRTSITPSLSADGKYFFFQAKFPAVYLDNLDKKLSYSEFQQREINNPVNDGKDIFWVETKYINLIKELKYSDVASAMLSVMNEKGIAEAIDLYWELKETYSDVYDFSEPMLNILGYKILGEEKFKEAIEIFKLNVKVYPESSNVYDSLGEAYMKDGQMERAIINYEKSLQLNSNNDNAKRMLERLKGNE